MSSASAWQRHRWPWYRQRLENRDGHRTGVWYGRMKARLDALFCVCLFRLEHPRCPLSQMSRQEIVHPELDRRAFAALRDNSCPSRLKLGIDVWVGRRGLDGKRAEESG